MKCKKCNGTGEIIVPVVGTMLYGKQQCDKCNGTGEVNTTNEEWFCQLPTEEKAEWLYYHSGAMSSKGDWEDWLKEKHGND